MRDCVLQLSAVTPPLCSQSQHVALGAGSVGGEERGPEAAL